MLLLSFINDTNIEGGLELTVTLQLSDESISQVQVVCQESGASKKIQSFYF